MAAIASFGCDSRYHREWHSLLPDHQEHHESLEGRPSSPLDQCYRQSRPGYIWGQVEHPKGIMLRVVLSERSGRRWPPAKVVSTRDVTLGVAIRRASFFLANTISTRGGRKKDYDNNITSVFPANMDACSQLLVFNPLFVSCLFWT